MTEGIPGESSGPRISLHMTWQWADPARLEGRRTVVIDVLRATTTIAAALSRGARSVWPAGEVDEARRLAANLAAGRKGGAAGEDAPSGAEKRDAPSGAGEEDAPSSGAHEAPSSGARRVLLAGERNNVRIEGFDLGNSPREGTAEIVAGADVVLCTTNGTRALAKARDAGSAEIYTAAFANAPAVADYLLAGADTDIAIICSGTKGSLALEDFLCGGYLVRRLTENNPAATVDDAARSAALAYGQAEKMWPEPLLRGTHAENLAAGGMGEDVEFCARTGLFSVVPVMVEGRLIDAGTRRQPPG